MTIIPFFLLTVGAINWGYAYPLVFLFVVLLRQNLLGKKVYLKFLYSPSFWLLLCAGLTYALIGERTITAIYHNGILPVVAFVIGWIIAEESPDELIRDGILALTAGFGVYAALNMFINSGNNRYKLIDFWTGSYRAATGSGILNTLMVSTIPYTVKFEKRLPVKLFFIILLVLDIRYMFMLGTRTQFFILLLMTIFATIQFSYSRYGFTGVIKCIVVITVIIIAAILVYNFNVLSVRDYILKTNLAARYVERASLEKSDSFRFHSFWRGLRDLFIYPLGRHRGQIYYHNMWLDVGRVSGIIPFATLLMYSVRNFKNVIVIWNGEKIIPALRYLLLFAYMGVYANFFVEPIWEGGLNLFLAMCVIDGMTNAMTRRIQNERNSEKGISAVPNICADL